VLSQAVFCDCDEGYDSKEIVGSDGKRHPYCLAPDEPLPSFDGGANVDASATLDAGFSNDGGDITYVTPSGCDCTMVGSARSSALGAMFGVVAAAVMMARRMSTRRSSTR
jgi:hypothetical protein